MQAEGPVEVWQRSKQQRRLGDSCPQCAGGDLENVVSWKHGEGLQSLAVWNAAERSRKNPGGLSGCGDKEVMNSLGKSAALSGTRQSREGKWLDNLV